MAVNVRYEHFHELIELLPPLHISNLCLRAPHSRGDVAAGQQVDPAHPLRDYLHSSGVDNVLYRHSRKPNARP